MKKECYVLFAVVVALTVCMGPAVADYSAAGDSGSCGKNLTWSFDSSTGELVIEGYGNMYTTWGPDSVPWTAYRNEIRSVSMPDGLYYVGNYAFYSCVNLKSLTFPEGVAYIAPSAFYSCESLETVVLPSTLEGYQYEAAWFAGCNSYVTVYDNTSLGLAPNHYGLSEHATVIKAGTPIITVDFYVDGSLYASKFEVIGGCYLFPIVPEKKGSYYGGWFTEEEGQGTEVTKKTVVSADDVTSLYVRWYVFDGAAF